MKNLFYLFTLVVLFASCQKRAYVTFIPAPTFEYHSSPQKGQVHAHTPEITAEALASVPQEDNAPAIPEESASTEIAAASTELASTTNTTFQPKKVSLKQRIAQRVVERKLTKMGVLKHTQPKAAKTDGVSVASFLAAILGIVGLFATGWLFLIGMVAAIVLGFIGLSRVRHSNGQLSGRGWAIAGLVLGFIELLLLILGVLFVAALISGFGA
ncbi:DUF4190 domain-containing protein [Runella limosa]|uniref:DUF4190 domain-containing protein n=1 Tax=Runella limosa TaxID=370978 RepID=UPI0004052CD0|nr:DUF4190 domain-containing protein [Runella limosa]